MNRHTEVHPQRGRQPGLILRETFSFLCFMEWEAGPSLCQSWPLFLRYTPSPTKLCIIPPQCLLPFKHFIENKQKTLCLVLLGFRTLPLLPDLLWMSAKFGLRVPCWPASGSESVCCSFPGSCWHWPDRGQELASPTLPLLADLKASLQKHLGRLLAPYEFTTHLDTEDRHWG